MSVCIISKTRALRLAPFLVCLTYFPLMQSMQYSVSEKSRRRRISSLINRSILPFEIWPKRQCHNFADVSLSHHLRLDCTFVVEEDSFFSSFHTTFTFSCIDTIYSLSCRKARPTHFLLDLIKHCSLPKWQSNPSSTKHDTEIKFLLKEGT
jgi:hypothetical protein